MFILIIYILLILAFICSTRAVINQIESFLNNIESLEKIDQEYLRLKYKDLFNE